MTSRDIHYSGLRGSGKSSRSLETALLAASREKELKPEGPQMFLVVSGYVNCGATPERRVGRTFTSKTGTR
jgi:hypothetical protein